MSFCVIFLATDVTIGNRNNQINERIVRILLETIHILNQSISIRAAHNGEMRINQTQRQMVHEFGAQSNEKLLLIQRRKQADHNPHITPQFV